MLLVILGCLVLVTALVVHGTRSVVAPASMMTIAWAILVLFAILFGSPYIHDASALAIMAALLACFVAGCLAVSAVQGKASPPTTNEGRWIPPLPRSVVLAGAVIGAIGAVVVSVSFGRSLLDVSSVSELFGASQENAVSLFTGEDDIPFAGKVCFSALQLGALLSGARYVFHWRQRQIWELGALAVPALMWALVTTQRSYILVPAVWWLSGLIGAYVYAGTLGRSVRFRSVISAAVGAFAFGVLVLAIRLVRTGETESVGSESLLDSSRTWLAGYIPAFSSWYVDDAASATSEHSWSGLLGGVMALVGQGADGLSGGYEYIGNGDSSNAATALRFFVSAGGVIAAGVMLFLIGGACQVAYRRAQSGHLGAALAYACLVAFILWSPNSWFYGYGGRILVVLLATGLVILATLVRRRECPSTTGRQVRPSVVPRRW